MRKRLEEAIRILAISFLAGLTLTGVSFAQQERVKPMVGRVVIVDGKGKIVGATLGGVGLHAMGAPGGSNALQPVVLLQADQHLVAVNVARDRLYGGPSLDFDSEDCKGTAWMSPESSREAPPLLGQSAIGTPGQTLYVVMPGAQPQSVAIRSTLAGSHLVKGGQCFNLNFSVTRVRVPAQPLVDLETVFTPPFSLRAAP